MEARGGNPLTDFFCDWWFEGFPNWSVMQSFVGHLFFRYPRKSLYYQSIFFGSCFVLVYCQKVMKLLSSITVNMFEAEAEHLVKNYMCYTYQKHIYNINITHQER